MRQLIRRLRTCESGTGLVEYGLLLALVALALVGVLTLFRGAAAGLTTKIALGVSESGAPVSAPAGGMAPAPVQGPAGGRPFTPDHPDDPSAEPDSVPASPDSLADPDSSSTGTHAGAWLFR